MAAGFCQRTLQHAGVSTVSSLVADQQNTEEEEAYDEEE